MTETIYCGECKAPMVLRESRFGPFYGCSRYPDCKGSHGAHKDTGKPLGVPADRETKEARIKAHASFDTLWKSRKMTRTQAYQWMRDAMSLEKDGAHIGLFTKEQCVRLIALVEAGKTP